GGGERLHGRHADRGGSRSANPRGPGPRALSGAVRAAGDLRALRAAIRAVLDVVGPSLPPRPMVRAALGDLAARGRAERAQVGDPRQARSAEHHRANPDARLDGPQPLAQAPVQPALTDEPSLKGARSPA